MIKTSSLSYSYNAEKKIHFGDLTIQSGAQFLLLGESGSGKTTERTILLQETNCEIVC